jgi:filamentous hemagglutinin family protein
MADAPPKPLHRTVLSLAVASCFAGSLVTSAFANPTNPTVVSGTAGIAGNGNTLTVTNTPGAVINWGAFSIGKNEITQFIQQNAASAVLNRVTGGDPSLILGTLTSNGRVFLINPNGITFGKGSQIDVGGLVASTLGLSNADFAAGRNNFTANANAGSIVNQGTINAGTGGKIYLVAPSVENSGVLAAPAGRRQRQNRLQSRRRHHSR